MALKKDLIFNGLGQVSSRIVRVIEQLLMVPIFLSLWGADYYGEWLTLSIIPSVLAFSDLGFGTAVSNSFVLSYSKNEKLEAAHLYKTGLVITSFTVLLGLFLSCLVIIISWETGLLEKSIISVTDVTLALIFLMASRLVSFYTQLFEGFYRAKHKAAIAYNLYALDSLLRIIIGVITLIAGCKIVGYSLGQFLIGTTFVIFFIYMSQRQIDDLPKGRFKKRIALTTLKTGLGFLLTPVWQSVYLQGTTFAVRIVLGPVAVAVFNTVRTVCQTVSSLFSIVNGSIYPEMQIAYGKGDMEMVKKIYVYSLLVVLLAALAGLFFLIVFGQTAYRWWTNNELQVPNIVWYIFMIGIPLNALWWTAGTVFRAFNKPGKFSIYGMISAVTAAILTFVFTYPLGLVGAALGFISMDFIMLILVIPMANREIGVVMKELYNYKDFKQFITNNIWSRKRK